MARVSPLWALFPISPSRGEGDCGGRDIAYGMGWLEKGYARVQRAGRSLGKSDTRPQLLELGRVSIPLCNERSRGGRFTSEEREDYLVSLLDHTT